MYGAKALAAETGGIAFYGNNDLRLGLQQAHEDSKAAYLLGYYPSHDEWDGKYRSIAVSVARPELSVRHRMGYFASPETHDLAPRDRRQAVAALAAAPDDVSAIRFNVEIRMLEDGARSVVVFVDPRTLSFEQKRGRWRDELDLVVVAQKENGESFPIRVESYNLDVPEDAYRDVILQKGVSLSSRLTPPEGAYRLRIVVREVRTGAAGSVTVPLRNGGSRTSSPLAGGP
jgi:LEA14-like dessication related protein